MRKKFVSLQESLSFERRNIGKSTSYFSQGTNVGLLAQQLFPGGIDVSPSVYFKMQESVFKTQELICDGETIIYEATFQFDGVIAAVDILVKNESGWRAYEVKSSTEVKPVNLDDAAIQYYTIFNSGIDLKDISIVHINNQYLRQGPLHIEELFTICSVLEEVKIRLPKIPNQIETFKNVIAQSTAPNMDIGPHCDDPYGCDFKGYCWKHIPDNSIFNISRLNKDKKFALYEMGIIGFEDIDLENNPMNGNQLMQVRSELNNEKHVDHEKIRTFINGLSYPLHFLDFETINPAVPLYNNSRPYQQIVFQYSLHIMYGMDEKPSHREFLALTDPNIDPRVGFIERLINDCCVEGDILVYNIGFERGKLIALTEKFPMYAESLKAIISRLKDLMEPFQKRWFYTPEMKGSYSIKAVLPALVPELSYDDLDIKEGGTASAVFAQMVNGQFSGDFDNTRENLREYCKMDTYTMVEIVDRLKII